MIGKRAKQFDQEVHNGQDKRKGKVVMESAEANQAGKSAGGIYYATSLYLYLYLYLYSYL